MIVHGISLKEDSIIMQRHVFGWLATAVHKYEDETANPLLIATHFPAPTVRST